MKEVVIRGVVNTPLNAEKWLDAFIEWIESRKEYFGGGVHDYVDGEDEKHDDVRGNTAKNCDSGILI